MEVESHSRIIRGRNALSTPPRRVKEGVVDDETKL